MPHFKVQCAYVSESTYGALGAPFVTIDRKRRDAAHLQWLRMVRDEIASIAGLDTAWGRQAFADAEQASIDVITYERVAFATVKIGPHKVASLWRSKN